jgi:predicted amino acid racemase
MFLDVTLSRNTPLIDTAITLHQKGLIEPNTYVIDLDMVRRNAQKIKEKADEVDIELYFMTKQFGRNPLVSRAIVESGIQKAVAVDPWEALVLANNGISLGHVGHLVQIPKRLMEPVLRHRPEVVTVFSYENAKVVSDTAQQLGFVQPILLRVVSPGDFIYPGQQGGFEISSLHKEIDRLKRLKGVVISGVTTFPCLLVEDGEAKATKNLSTLIKAKEILYDKGYSHLQINTPSVSSVSTLSLLKEYGSTHAEPGHSLTGTTPLHVKETEPEIPAMVYVSEVSHVHGNQAFVYGGGFYPRSQMKGALVGKNIDSLIFAEAYLENAESIDYYITLNTNRVSVGDTAIFSFRTQIFVTRSKVAVVEGIGQHPKIIGVFNSEGMKL